MATRPVIGVVSKCDHPYANPERAKLWLELAGCKRIFFTSSYTHNGMDEIIKYLDSDEI